MFIGGIQKFGLLDFPGQVAATVFTSGCNMRCPYCQNASLVFNRAADISTEDALAFLSKRRGLLDGVCITGGEPLIHKETADFIARVKALGFKVKLDTNGTNPAVLENLIRDGLVDYVAVDVKNCREKYAETVGTAAFDIKPVEKTVELLLSDIVDFEFRTTVVREFHTADDLLKLARWISGTKKYFLQQFRDSGDLIQAGLHGFSDEEMKALGLVVSEIIPDVQIR